MYDRIFINKTGFVLNGTVFVLNILVFILNMTRFVIDMNIEKNIENSFIWWYGMVWYGAKALCSIPN